MLALACVLLLRLLHMQYALAGPLTWQMGADEDFYWRFAHDVAFGSGGLQDGWAFMDPLYAYLLGAILKLGAGAFPIYVLQIAVDCLSAYGMYRIAALLGRPRAGLIAIFVYAITGTAIAYTMALLKATWVAAFVVWWMYGALSFCRNGRLANWLGFGVLCGIGVALRANLLLMAPLALLCAGWLRWREGDTPKAISLGAACLLAGLAMPLFLLVARNAAISEKYSPMPNNGGIVLHQIYNVENPEGRAGVPSFVGRYSAPGEIWDGYRAEAERRAGTRLTPQAVDAYWREQASTYIESHRLQSVGNAVRKLREASAYPEVPNTRNYVDERIVSPLLHALPLPFGWLFALGVPGLALLTWRDRRGIILLAPLAMGALTLAVFFAEDRFRFNVIAPFVVGTGIWVDALWRALATRQWRSIAAGILITSLLGAWTLSQARLLIPEFPSDWTRLAWGYLKSGQEDKARAILQAQPPGTPGVDELLGYLAVREQRWDLAIAAFERAVEFRQDRHEVWHNFSLALEGGGRTEDALAAAAQALRLRPAEPDYLIHAGDLLIALKRPQEAEVAWMCALNEASPPQRQLAIERLGGAGLRKSDAVGHLSCPK
ncbi:glycosyltransferase family 39 protein [Luteimonas sp. SMYT11W]|uniref:Glycosyltransferase family 39 protein n=1 Tax=Luteimonas flava TaxID=3115822 RepID=A0ABU7WIN8_9GAMM